MFEYDLFDAYFALLKRQNSNIVPVPSEFINECLLLPKCISKKKLKGFGWQKAMKNPWKVDFPTAIEHWCSIVEKVMFL